jgi:hypothetical protein
MSFNTCLKLPECSSGSYLYDRECLACGVGCDSCQSPLKCDKCLGGYVTYNQQCVKDCPPGTAAPTCKPCPSECQTCNSYGCLLCKPGYTPDPANIGRCQVLCVNCRACPPS